MKLFQANYDVLSYDDRRILHGNSRLHPKYTVLLDLGERCWYSFEQGLYTGSEGDVGLFILPDGSFGWLFMRWLREVTP
jgi:hypothetical protein